MNPTVRLKYVGIRPGEKLHEVMCPADDSHLTIEFNDHYVISPTIVFENRNVDFQKNKLGETGMNVEHGFEYSSGNNPSFLGVDQIVEFNSRA
jgi:UDP-N-acetylglucosamine 4,6-dehydratase